MTSSSLSKKFAPTQSVKIVTPPPPLPRHWTRELWLEHYPDPIMREYLASIEPMAWILEYQPKILFPGKGLIAFEPYPFQQDFINCKDTYRAINKPRQCGISTAVAAEVAWEFCHVPGAQIVIVSKDLDAAQNFMQYVQAVLESVKDVDPRFPKITKLNQRKIENINGSRITSIAASKSAGRSFSATHLIFDEMAFAEFADQIWTSASPTLSRTGGRATIISTPNGRANMFYRIFEEKNHLGFTVFDYKWWDVPDYNPYYDKYVAAKARKNKKAEKLYIAKARQSKWYVINRASKTDLQWKQEFEGAFDANKGAVFSTRSLENTFHLNYLTHKEHPYGLLSEWWTSKREDNHLYATGIDLGRKNDATCLITYDYTHWPARIVDFKYIDAGLQDWSGIERVVLEHLAYWKGKARHDATGVGDQFSDKFYMKSEDFVFSKNGKQNILERMQHAMDCGKLRAPKIATLHHEHQRYEWDDKDLTTDTVMANALAISLFYSTDSIASAFYQNFSLTGLADA